MAAELLPQLGVALSKWQFTLAQEPGTGDELCGKAEVMFLYVVRGREELMRADSLIRPSRCELV